MKPKSLSILSNDLTALKSKKLILSSPELTGTPTAITPSLEDNSSKIATTEYVSNIVNSIPIGGLSNLTTLSRDNLVNSINTIHGIVSNNKKSLVKSITEKGQEADISDTFETLAGKIMDIVDIRSGLGIGTEFYDTDLQMVTDVNKIFWESKEVATEPTATAYSEKSNQLYIGTVNATKAIYSFNGNTGELKFVTASIFTNGVNSLHVDSDDFLYAGGNDPRVLVKLDSEGKLIWQSATAINTIDTITSDINNNVYRFGSDYYLNKYASNGTLLWSVKPNGTSYTIKSLSYKDPDVLYAITTTGVVFKINTNDGSIIQTVPLDKGSGSTIEYSPFDNVVFLSRSGFLEKRDVDLKLIWAFANQAASTNTQFKLDNGGTPIITTTPSLLRKVDVNSGRLLWDYSKSTEFGTLFIEITKDNTILLSNPRNLATSKYVRNRTFKLVNKE